jgi:transcription antitermination factor NusG
MNIIPPVKKSLTTYWGFAKCRSNMMATAATGLLDQRFVIYAPKTFERLKVAGGAAQVVAHYRLPPYLFVQFEEDTEDLQHVIDQAGLVASQRGIQHVYCDDRGRPFRVSMSEIQYLRRLEEDQMGDAQKRPRGKETPFLPGVWVRIDRHANFAGQEGEIRTSIRGMSKVIIGTIVIEVADCDISLAKRPVAERIAG